MLRKVLFSAILYTFALSALAGGNSSGGTDPEKSNVVVLTQLIQSGGLQNAMSNYIKSLDLKQLKNQYVELAFNTLFTKEKLLADVNSKDIYKINSDCKDFYNKKVSASALIGQPGTPICFDVITLAKQYKQLNEEEIMIRLAAVAFHEHVHHFQDPRKSIQENEKVAYEFEAYVRLTARVLQTPVLKWSAPDSVADCPDFTGYYVNYSPDFNDYNNQNGKMVTEDRSIKIKLLTKNSVEIFRKNEPFFWDLDPKTGVSKLLLNGATHIISDEKTSPSDPGFLHTYIGTCTIDKIIIDELMTIHSGNPPHKKLGTELSRITLQKVGDALQIETIVRSIDLKNKEFKRESTVERYNQSAK